MFVGARNFEFGFGKENLFLGMADVQESLRQGVIGDPFLNTIQEQFAEYLKQCV